MDENRYYKIADPLEGVLLGIAVGDSLGLPAEGLSPQRIKKNSWSPWKHRLFFGKGMISDDTEHSFFVAQAILREPKDSAKFQRALASKLRWWLLSLPAGTGLGTARAILKLWLGFPPTKSGVFSAGNGPAMRSAIIGACFHAEPDKMYEYVKASTLLTHTDPRALTGAFAVAQLTSYLILNDGQIHRQEVIQRLKAISFLEEEWLAIIAKIESSLEVSLSVEDFAKEMNLERGITGYIYHTVPMVIYTLLLHEADFEVSLTALLNCGGDSDTTGAILASILGACGKHTKIPKPWVDDIIEWPRSIGLLKKVAHQLNRLKEGQEHSEVSYFVPFILLRNLIFLIIVLAHGLMRLFTTLKF